VILLGLIFFANTVCAQIDTIPPTRTDTIPPVLKSDTVPPTRTDTLPPGASVDPELLNIYSSKVPREFIIADIKVTGSKFFDEALVISISGLSVGDKVMIPGGDNFAKAINKLWSQNLFTNIQDYITKLQGQNIWIEINAVERPQLSSFSFKGVKKSDADELDTKSGLVKGRVVTENMKITAVENIQKFYADKGYKAVDVKIQEQGDPAAKNSVILTFVINKGEKVKVDEIEFFGNENISESKLKGHMKGTKEMSRITLYPTAVQSPYGTKHSMTFHEYMKDWGFMSPTKTMEYLYPYFRFKFFSSAKFNQKKYDSDKESVIDYYNSQGYRDAEIVKDTQYYNMKGGLVVDIKVNEGHKYYFGNITWRGNTKYSDSLLNAFLGIHKGDVYNLETLNKRLGKQLTQEGGDLSGLYMDDGYLFFRVEPVETAVYNDTIDHEIRIIEGPQATIKNVLITGNDRTKEYVIRRELRTVPGEKFSRTDIIRSQREISNLGFFNQEKIGINPIPNQEDGTVDIHYSVEEKSADQLELSAGFGGGIGLTGTLGVTFNNFSIKNIFNKKAWDPLPAGDGQKLSLRFQSNGRYYRSYNFSFTEPWLGGKKRNSFTVSFYSTKYSNAVNPITGQYLGKNADTSYLKTTGITLALGKQLQWPDDYFTLVYSLSYTQYRVRNYPIFPGLTNNDVSQNISLKIALSRSSIDQPIFPRSGSNFLFSVQLTPPYSYIRGIDVSNPYKFVEYHKWRFNGEWYVPLGKPGGADKSRQLVMKLGAKFGFIGRYNPDLEISPFERFQLGDAGLTNTYSPLGYEIIAHRGYPVYQNSDPRINPDISNATRFFTIFNKYTAELRYPFVTNPSSTIYGLAFYEAANGWYDFKEWNPFRLRRSVGLGMRFFLPMFGLLGFDYGIGLDRFNPNSKLKDISKFTFMLGFEPE